MTNLSDYLNDLIIEASNIEPTVDYPFDEQKDDILQKYLAIIKNKWIGE